MIDEVDKSATITKSTTFRNVSMAPQRENRKREYSSSRKIAKNLLNRQLMSFTKIVHQPKVLECLCRIVAIEPRINGIPEKKFNTIFDFRFESTAIHYYAITLIRGRRTNIKVEEVKKKKGLSTMNVIEEEVEGEIEEDDGESIVLDLRSVREFRKTSAKVVTVYFERKVENVLSIGIEFKEQPNADFVHKYGSAIRNSQLQDRSKKKKDYILPLFREPYHPSERVNKGDPFESYLGGDEAVGPTLLQENILTHPKKKKGGIFGCGISSSTDEEGVSFSEIRVSQGGIESLDKSMAIPLYDTWEKLQYDYFFYHIWIQTEKGSKPIRFRQYLEDTFVHPDNKPSSLDERRKNKKKYPSLYDFLMRYFLNENQTLKNLQVDIRNWERGEDGKRFIPKPKHVTSLLQIDIVRERLKYYCNFVLNELNGRMSVSYFRVLEKRVKSAKKNLNLKKMENNMRHKERLLWDVEDLFMKIMFAVFYNFDFEDYISYLEFEFDDFEKSYFEKLKKEKIETKRRREMEETLKKEEERKKNKIKATTTTKTNNKDDGDDDDDDESDLEIPNIDDDDDDYVGESGSDLEIPEDMDDMDLDDLDIDNSDDDLLLNFDDEDNDDNNDNKNKNNSTLLDVTKDDDDELWEKAMTPLPTTNKKGNIPVEFLSDEIDDIIGGEIEKETGKEEEEEVEGEGEEEKNPEDLYNYAGNNDGFDDLDETLLDPDEFEKMMLQFQSQYFDLGILNSSHKKKKKKKKMKKKKEKESDEKEKRKKTVMEVISFKIFLKVLQNELRRKKMSVISEKSKCLEDEIVLFKNQLEQIEQLLAKKSSMIEGIISKLSKISHESTREKAREFASIRLAGIERDMSPLQMEKATLLVKIQACQESLSQVRSSLEPELEKIDRKILELNRIIYSDDEGDGEDDARVEFLTSPERRRMLRHLVEIEAEEGSRKREFRVVVKFVLSIRKSKNDNLIDIIKNQNEGVNNNDDEVVNPEMRKMKLMKMLDGFIKPEFFRFGVMHASVLVKNLGLHWFSNSLVRVKELRSNDFYEDIICLDTSCPLVGRPGLLYEKFLEMAQTIVYWNAKVPYAPWSTDMFKRSRRNCQQFSEQVLRGLEATNYYKTVNGYLDKLKEIVLNKTISSDKSQEYIQHLKFIMFSQSKMFFKSYYRFYPDLEAEHREMIKQSKKGEKDRLIFRTHRQLDEFVRKYVEKDHHFQANFPGEYQLLKGFDRAFSMLHQKTVSGVGKKKEVAIEMYKPSENGCPFNVKETEDGKQV